MPNSWSNDKAEIACRVPSGASSGSLGFQRAEVPQSNYEIGTRDPPMCGATIEISNGATSLDDAGTLHEKQLRRQRHLLVLSQEIALRESDPAQWD